MQCALELGRTAFHKLSPSLHLRCLHVLCNDLAESNAMRAELQNRVDTLVAQVEVS